MKEEKRRELLEAFANDLSVVKGGGMKIIVNHGHTSFVPREGYPGFKYEDSNYVYDTLRGAETFMFYLERQGYKIVGGKKK